jgi:integrase
MCETGARINEIANIRVCDIKLKEKAILLSWSKTTPRPVFFTPETAIYLDKHLERFFLILLKIHSKKYSLGKT